MQRTVANLLEGKGRDVYSIGPSATVHSALELMRDCGVGALVVTEEDAIVGIISERDFARRIIDASNGPREMLVSEIMTAKVRTVTPDKTVLDCMALMTNHRFRHLPVVEEERLIGVISIGDVVRSVITDQESLIEDLERYITS